MRSGAAHCHDTSRCARSSSQGRRGGGPAFAARVGPRRRQQGKASDTWWLSRAPDVGLQLCVAAGAQLHLAKCCLRVLAPLVGRLPAQKQKQKTGDAAVPACVPTARLGCGSAPKTSQGALWPAHASNGGLMRRPMHVMPPLQPPTCRTATHCSLAAKVAAAAPEHASRLPLLQRDGAALEQHAALPGLASWQRLRGGWQAAPQHQVPGES